MNSYAQFEAFLHIVHISDMHYRDAASPADPKGELKLRAIAQRLRTLNANLADTFEELVDLGYAGHDPSAERELGDFFDWFAADPDFGSIPAWLVDTGDLSAIGDLESLTVAKATLQDYGRRLRATATFSQYGNHDAWPATFPMLARRSDVATHRDTLRQQLFASVWPQGPLGIPIPNTQSQLVLYGVNTTIDDRWRNTWARGHVGRDPRWLQRKGKGALSQMQVLADDVQRGFRPDGSRDFRVLAMHHPVHYPPPRPVMSMSLSNDIDVGDALSRFGRLGRGKLAELVLSGHTHVPFPALGELPPDNAKQYHDPLGRDQLQLIAGSSAQMVRATSHGGTASGPLPHQFQVLTFYASPARQTPRLVMERRLVGRLAGTGPFGFLQLPGTRNTVEAAWLDY